jgi:ABC-2 type transport system permease protein
MRPRHLLAGKVIAMGAIGFGEIVLTGAAILFFGESAGSFEIPAATTTGLAAVLIWFVLGFAFYATVYGAAGAMVRRHTDSSNVAAPLNLFVAVGYMIGVFSAGPGQGSNPVLTVASMLPPTAPFTMPVRMIRGSAAGWEIGLSMLLIAAAAYGLVRLAGRVYAGALLRTGKIGWRDSWRAAGELS